MEINLYNDNIIVTELQDDLKFNGTVVMYDSDSPYMFCKVECVSVSAKDNGINPGEVLVIKRYAKEEYLPGTYFISYKDIRGSMSLDDYNEMKVEEN